MKSFRIVLLIGIVALSAAIGFLLGQSSAVDAQKKPTPPGKNPPLMSYLKKERIKTIRFFEDEASGSGFYAFIREGDESAPGDHLTVYDKFGRSVYELQDARIESVETVRLKPGSRQLLIETNGGGTDNFLKIVEFRNGKFSELVKDSETQLRGGYFTIPQYRTGNKSPYFGPAQLVVIQQIGGADENPAAAVFRYQNKRFQKAGSFSMRDLGDLIERQLAVR